MEIIVFDIILLSIIGILGLALTIVKKRHESDEDVEAERQKELASSYRESWLASQSTQTDTEEDAEQSNDVESTEEAE